MLNLNDIACRRDGRVLFAGVSLSIMAGQHVALTGANGSGKSSLFAMIRGELEADEGEITVQQGVRIASVAQETPALPRAAIDFVLDGDAHLREVERALSQAASLSGEAHANLLLAYEQLGGYSARARAGALLNGLGFAGTRHALPVADFSGGWRMRLNLARALFSPAELLLLDEPTNHLDLDTVLWLESWLQQCEATVLLISHDREFLDRTTTHTLHIEHEKLTLYAGNYSAFELQRAAALERQQSEYAKSQQRRAELQSFVDRFRAKATKARQAQSRLKMLERLDAVAPLQARSPLRFRFAPPDALPNPLIALRAARVGYGDTVVLDKVGFSVQSGDRIGLLGANGAGKSTLIKALVGELPLQAGERVTAQQLSVGYFAQHQVDRLHVEDTPLSALMTRFPDLDDRQARTILGGFGFQGDQALQRVATLSGGERARLALALIVQQRPNLLLLDEPTNHLDIDMREALADALLDYRGALIVISHDRTLLRTVVDEFRLVSDASVGVYDDDLDGYARWLARQRDAVRYTDEQDMQAAAPSRSGDSPSPSTDAGARREQKRSAAEQRARLRPLKQAAAASEARVQQCESALQRVRDGLADNGLYNADRKNELASLLAEEAGLRVELAQLEEQWLEHLQALEDANQQEETR